MSELVSTRPTLAQLIAGYRETRATQNGVVTMTGYPSGVIRVSFNAVDRTFRSIEAARRHFDRIAQGEA